MMLNTTLPALLANVAREYPNRVAHWVLNDCGQWQAINFSDFYRQVIDVASQLIKAGIGNDDVVAIMAGTSQEWEVVHHAILLIGCVVVGIDPGETAEHLTEMIDIASVRYLLVDHTERLNKFSEDVKNKFELVFYFKESVTPGSDTLKMLDLQANGASDLDISSLVGLVKPENTATIIFTSGTTGTPKGIVYKHNQLIAAIHSIRKAYPELHTKPCYLVCWLPLSNLFQRIVNLCAIASGAEVYFVENPQELLEHLPKINPHIFIAVPRFYEKLNQGFETKLAQKSKAVVWFLRGCLTIGEKTSLIGKLFKKFNYHLFKPFTSLFGSNLNYFISGSAPMPLWLLKRFDAMGLLVLEAYGLSENVVPIAVNRRTDYRFGTVGKVLSGNEVRLADDGELLVKGIGVFGGYLTRDQQDRSVDHDGYLLTGDYAEMDAEGFIRLTGRKSEVFKTSTGRKIAPVGIEALLQSEPSIEHAVVIGASRKFLVALLMVGRLEFASKALWMRFILELRMKLRQSLVSLPEYQRPVGVVLCFKSLSYERHELTGNLKLRRKIIQQHYAEYLDRLYDMLDEPNSSICREPVEIDAEVVFVAL